MFVLGQVDMEGPLNMPEKYWVGAMRPASRRVIGQPISPLSGGGEPEWIHLRVDSNVGDKAHPLRARRRAWQPADLRPRWTGKPTSKTLCSMEELPETQSPKPLFRPGLLLNQNLSSLNQIPSDYPRSNNE